MEPVSDLQTIRNGGYTLRRRRQNYREAAYTPRSPEKTLTYRWDDFKGVYPLFGQNMPSFF